MAAVHLGPIDDVGVLGAGTAFPARTVDNLEVLRGLPPEAHGRRGRPDEEELRFVAALAEARAAGRRPRGTLLALAAVGVGMSWAAAVLKC